MLDGDDDGDDNDDDDGGHLSPSSIVINTKRSRSQMKIRSPVVSNHNQAQDHLLFLFYVFHAGY